MTTSHLIALRQRTQSDLPEDQFFERFSAEQILKPRDLDVGQLESGIVRGTLDGGIDSIYLFANGKFVDEGMLPATFHKQNVHLHLILIQATQSAGFDQERIRKFTDFSNHLLDLTKNVDAEAQRYNKEIRTAVKSFRDWWTSLITQLPTLQITFYIASKGNEPHPDVLTRAHELEVRVMQLYPCQCEVIFFNAKALIESARQSRREPLTLQFTEQLSSNLMGNAYVCLVSLDAFVAFIANANGEQREYILEPNVRAYLGEGNDVNTQIRATLNGATDKEEFWWLNNGVTIITPKIHPSTRELTLEEPKIVNGLQTSREIYNYSRTKKKEGDPRHILVRVIEIADKNTANHIVRTTNNQSRIPQVYLHGTEDVHEKLELAFPAAGLFYERQKNKYVEDEKPREKIVTLPYLMQALIAIVLQEPDQARARPTQFGEREYKKLFRDQDRPELYIKTALLMKRVEQFLKKRTPAIERNEQNNLKFYVAMYAASMLSRRAKPSRVAISQLKTEEATDSFLEECLSLVNHEYQCLSKNSEPDLIAKGSQLIEHIKSELTKKFKNELGRRKRH